MAGHFLMTLIYLIPMAAIMFFIVSLCNYINAKKQYKSKQNEENLLKKNTTKTLLIVSSVIMGVLLVVVIGFMVLMYMAIAYM